MSKRFTDTAKWQPWFRALDCRFKLLWIYICDQCDHAGVWERDDEMAKLFVDPTLDLDEAIKAINADKERIVVFDGNRKLFLRDFVSFQYGVLKPECKPHASVFRALEKHGIDPVTLKIKRVSRPTTNPIHRVKDKEKEEDKDKEEGGAGGVLTPLQEVVRAWKIQSGVDPDDKAWDKEYYPRNCKAAESLLNLFSNDVGAVCDCIEAIYKQYVDKRGLNLSLQGVVNNAARFRQDWLEKKARKDLQKGVA